MTWSMHRQPHATRVAADGSFSAHASSPGPHSLTASCTVRGQGISLSRSIAVPQGGLTGQSLRIPTGDASIELVHPPSEFGLFLRVKSIDRPELVHFPRNFEDGRERTLFQFLTAGAYEVLMSIDQQRSSKRVELAQGEHRVVELP